MMNEITLTPYEENTKRISLDELSFISFALSEKAKKEAVYLWRLARKAQAHGVSAEIVHAIREEANYCYYTLATYPDRMLMWDFKYNMYYAFK